jgi:hypothetical protein
MNTSVRNIIYAVGLIVSLCKCRTDSDKEQTSLNTVGQTNNAFEYQNHLEVVKKFATNFQPDSLPYDHIGTLGNPPDSVVYAFKALRQLDTVSHKRYLTVIFLKLYLDHLRCCHQSYEIRSESNAPIDSVADPLAYEYLLATRFFNTTQSIEMLNSGIGDTYLEKNTDLLKYNDIKNLKKQIEAVGDSIVMHLYWK